MSLVVNKLSLSLLLLLVENGNGSMQHRSAPTVTA